MEKYLVIIYLVWNLAVMAVYGVDKLKAKHNAWRIPEKVLIGFAFFMGAAGAWCGMQLFRHKTQHKLFTIGVPICFICNILMVFGGWFLVNVR